MWKNAVESWGILMIQAPLSVVNRDSAKALYTGKPLLLPYILLVDGEFASALFLKERIAFTYSSSLVPKEYRRC